MIDLAAAPCDAKVTPTFVRVSIMARHEQFGFAKPSSWKLRKELNSVLPECQRRR